MGFLHLVFNSFLEILLLKSPDVIDPSDLLRVTLSQFVGSDWRWKFLFVSRCQPARQHYNPIMIKKSKRLCQIVSFFMD